MREYEKKKGLVIWLTGLPSSGKTTVSKKLEKYFKDSKLAVARLDGDTFRKKHTEKLGFTKKDRNENIKRAAKEAKKLSEKNINVIAAFVSPYEQMRKFARKTCPNFIEVYLRCGLQECIRRDKKGMYKKALAGKIKNFTGVSDPYEEPCRPEIVLNTEGKKARGSSQELISQLGKITKWLK